MDKKKNVLIKQKILCIHKLAQRTTIKAFFYLDEITQYYSDTMKIHVLSDIAQEILHHEIYTYLSFGCTWRNGYRPHRLATMAGAVVLISRQNDQYYE